MGSRARERLKANLGEALGLEEVNELRSQNERLRRDLARAQEHVQELRVQVQTFNETAVCMMQIAQTQRKLLEQLLEPLRSEMRGVVFAASHAGDLQTLDKVQRVERYIDLCRDLEKLSSMPLDSDQVAMVTCTEIIAKWGFEQPQDGILVGEILRWTMESVTGAMIATASGLDWDQ